jgi:hypothetical protein
MSMTDSAVFRNVKTQATVSVAVATNRYWHAQERCNPGCEVEDRD